MPPPWMVSTEAAFVLIDWRSCFNAVYVGMPLILTGTSGNDSMRSFGDGIEVVMLPLTVLDGVRLTGIEARTSKPRNNTYANQLALLIRSKR